MLDQESLALTADSRPIAPLLPHLSIREIHICGRFLIDPDGIIQAAEILTPAVGRNVDETIRQVQAFQHVRATGGAEASPSGWEPGGPTLKAGPDLVGKVWKP